MLYTFHATAWRCECVQLATVFVVGELNYGIIRIVHERLLGAVHLRAIAVIIVVIDAELIIAQKLLKSITRIAIRIIKKSQKLNSKLKIQLKYLLSASSLVEWLLICSHKRSS